MNSAPDWPVEWPEIVAMCCARAIDPALIAAIRNHERGRPGLEYGVKSQPAPDRASQLRLCSRTVAGALARFAGNPFLLIDTPAGLKRLTYKLSFVQQLGEQYSPASADPTNQFWIPRVTQYYDTFVQHGIAT